MMENCGSQDQIWASYGGINFIKFNKNGKFNVNRLKLTNSYKNNLNENLVLIYTGIHKFSNIVEKDKLSQLFEAIRTCPNDKELKIKYIIQYDYQSKYNNKHEIGLLHCNSTYPAPIEELNLSGIKTLNERYPDFEIGRRVKSHKKSKRERNSLKE